MSQGNTRQREPLHVPREEQNQREPPQKPQSPKATPRIRAPNSSCCNSQGTDRPPPPGSDGITDPSLAQAQNQAQRSRDPPAWQDGFTAGSPNPKNRLG